MIFKWILYGTFVASYMGVDDGKHVHLYEWADDQNRTPHHISFNHTEAIRPEQVKAIKVECRSASGVDEEASDRTNLWITYRAYICNGFEVIMKNGTLVVVDEKLKEDTENYFEEIAKQNAEKKLKAAQDRIEANKKVLKSYRIK